MPLRERERNPPLKKLEKNPRYQDCFAKLGDTWEVEQSLFEDLEEFVCFLSGLPRQSDFDKVRAVMLKKMVGEGEVIKSSSKVDLSKLPVSRLIPASSRLILTLDGQTTE